MNATNTVRVTTESGSTRGARTPRGLSILSILLLTSGCSHSPTLNLLGSYFPAWMLCAVLGVIAAIVIRQILRSYGIDEYVLVPLLTYACFAVAGGLLSWLLWFT
jgi:hypothetical protein